MKLWVARDIDGVLFLYDNIPERKGDYFEPTGSRDIPLDDKMFPEVTFENSPQEVEIKLVNNITNGFAEDLFTNCKPLEGEFSKFVDDNFDNLILL